MDRRRGSAAQEFEDFDPVVEWKLAGEVDVVEISLPGFRKDQVRVMVDNRGVLRATGERPARGGRWARFKKDLLLPDNCDADAVRARFEGEKLIITLPIAVPADETAPPSPGTPPSPTPSPSPGPTDRPPADYSGPTIHDQTEPTTAEPKPSPSPSPHGTLGAVPEPIMPEREIPVSPPSPAPLPPDSRTAPGKKNQAQAGMTMTVPPPEPERQLLVNTVAAAVVLVGIVWWVWRNLSS